MSLINREQLAWAAGVFDGEGWASSARYNRKTGGRTATLVIGVGQAHRGLLDRFQVAVGIGNVTGPTKSRKTQMWAFRAHGFESVQAIFAMLYPWLGSIKRAQIQAVLNDALANWPKQRKRRFTIMEIQDIRKQLLNGIPQWQIARQYKCLRASINAIARGRTYV